MDDQTDYSQIGNTNQQTRFRGTGTDFGAMKNAKRQDVSGLAATIKAGQDEFKPPKQMEGEDSSAYGARVAQARSAFRQKQAMK